ncbi:MPN121 family protein [Mycoplasmoides pirum]|uniref:MPN121 family protein n=1 Tax=Mycoplasmoides pirum TaxID=2122 RepID=UPI00047FCAF7|nr:hypothetical protein [Mycoplasmoides pirum]
MSNNSKKIKIEIEIDEEVKKSLEESLNKIIKLNQLPENTSVEQFIVLVLKNYIQSSKAMENMSGDFINELKEKLEGIFNPEDIGSEDFYKKMMNNFKDFLNPDAKKSDKKNDDDKKTDNDKKKS